MSLFSFLTSAGGGAFAGAGLSSALQARSARKQMDFQERMSDTSYQRAVKDMRAAGINPMLAATKGGASTPSGAGMGVTNPMADFFSAQQMKAVTNKLKAEADSAKARSEFDKRYYKTLNATGGTNAKALSDGYGDIASGLRSLFPRVSIHKKQ